MSTLVFVDPEISTQADGARSPRVPVPFPEDPYEAIRHAYLVETETPESPTPITRMVVCVLPAMSPGLSASIAEVVTMSDLAFRKRFRSSYESSPSSSPPDLPLRKRYRGTYELVEDDEEEDEEIEESSDSDSESEGAKDEGPTAEDEDPTTGDKGLAAGDEGPGMRVESLSLGGDAAVPEGQQRAALIVETTMGEPLGLGYEALRHR
ncbi:hypothetical protein Tco_1376038 [Tanacetum coccineum]